VPPRVSCAWPQGSPCCVPTQHTAAGTCNTAEENKTFIAHDVFLCAVSQCALSGRGHRVSAHLCAAAMQVAEEDEILAQADQIIQQRKEQAAAKRPQGAPLLHAASFSNSVGELPFFDANVIPTCPPKPGVYSRRAMLDDALKARRRRRRRC
jgi:hypothetical protein